jgi:NAD-dependent deacetylase
MFTRCKAAAGILCSFHFPGENTIQYMEKENTVSQTINPIPFDAYTNIFILTGAGVSVASGLPTYRGPGGLWEQADIARIADANNLPGTLPDLWHLYAMRRRYALAAEPNAAHRAIAEVQKRWSVDGTRRITLATQNVDGLHARAGSPEVVELHGSAFTTRCSSARCTAPSFHDENIYDEVPLCAECGAPLRPGVVLFSEQLPVEALYQVKRALRDVDLFIAVGTSGVVWPAAQFVGAAAYVGARTINVNVEPMEPYNPAFHEEYVGPAEEILPKMFGVNA